MEYSFLGSFPIGVANGVVSVELVWEVTNGNDSDVDGNCGIVPDAELIPDDSDTGDVGDAEPDDVREGGTRGVDVDGNIFVIILYIDYINFLNSI